MKKILIITNHSYMLYRFRKELIETLKKENEVILSMPFVGHEEDFRRLGVKCIETKINRRGINFKEDFKLLSTYYHILKDVKPDLVITYSIKPNIYAGIVCGKLGVPFFANVQGLGTAFQKKILSQLVTFLYKFSFKKVEKVFFENEENALEFQKRHIIPQEKQKVLHGAGVNLEDYCYKPYPENDRVHFLYLGRIMREKGISELFTAVRKLHNEGAEFVLDMVGFFEDEYKEQVGKLQKDGIVVFHGFQEEPRPYYELADCVVLPSYHEGLSNVLLEAAAMGRPIITSDIPGCRETIDAEISGVLVPVRDSESLYNAMKKFLNLPLGKKIAMGQAGRKKMEREFCKKLVVADTIKILGTNQRE